MAKSKVTLSIDDKKWTDFRIKCLREKRTASELVEEFIDSYTKKYSTIQGSRKGVLTSKAIGPPF